jgi:hypothetical protein
MDVKVKIGLISLRITLVILGCKAHDNYCSINGGLFSFG